MEQIPISREGYEKVMQELEELKAQRPEVIEAIAEARDEGDLSENAGYDAARERQGMLEAKINYIESRVPLFNVIDLCEMGGDKACFGATVEIEDVDTGETKKFTLLGPDEADLAHGSVSVHSPLGRGMLGKEVGDEFTVQVPRGSVTYEIVSIDFNHSGG